MLAKYIDEETGLVSVALGDDTEWYTENGFTEMDVDEEPYNGCYYIRGKKPSPTIQEQITALEDSITKRNYRAALLGDEYALNKIQETEAQIEELRKQL